MKILASSFFITLIGLLSGYYITDSYNLIENNYTIKFSTSKAEGRLYGLAGKIDFISEDLINSTIDVTVDVSTIKTGNKTKDKHARNSKWFDTDKYPSSRFISSSIEKIGNSYQVTGQLSIKEITQEHTFVFDTIRQEGLLYLSGTTSINRKTFNIKGNRLGFLVGDNVAVNIMTPAKFSN